MFFNSLKTMRKRLVESATLMADPANWPPTIPDTLIGVESQKQMIAAAEQFDQLSAAYRKLHDDAQKSTG
jgi:hypothetical protein